MNLSTPFLQAYIHLLQFSHVSMSDLKTKKDKRKRHGSVDKRPLEQQFH